MALRTPMRSAMKKSKRKNRRPTTASRLTFVSTPMVREYFGDAPVLFNTDMKENLQVSPSCMRSRELQQELEVREAIDETGEMSPSEKALKVDTLWREELENELQGYDFPVRSDFMIFFIKLDEGKDSALLSSSFFFFCFSFS